MDPAAPSLAIDPATPEFSEAPVWDAIGRGWRHLAGSFRNTGYSVEWHDFTTERAFDWAPSFHSGGVEICLNLAGSGNVTAASRRLDFGPSVAGFYFQNQKGLQGSRAPGERHQFLTVELSVDFLSRHIGSAGRGINGTLRRVLRDGAETAVSEPLRLTTDHRSLALALCRPPVPQPAQTLWYWGKVLELISTMLFEPAEEGEFFCQRQKRLNGDRVQKVIRLLQENLAEPPSLEEIGRRVGCSHFHLSRIFSQEMGCGVFQHLRTLRMERAAQLLREKRLNVTEVAMEVGYSSPSHFSTAFHQTFGCCPGLYPLRTVPVRTR